MVFKAHGAKYLFLYTFVLSSRYIFTIRTYICERLENGYADRPENF